MSEPVSVIEKYPDYKVDIGIEVHVQLNTQSKIFCSCSNAQTDKPNTYICQICAGYPGSLPVLNETVVEKAIRAGLATNSTITEISQFARKHYFYPDLPKNYQITQDNKPVCKDGYVAIRKQDGSSKNIRLIRIHIEEDAGKSIHAAHANESFVDLNRTGTPLLEIVSHPDIESTEEVKIYLKTLRNIIYYTGISTCNMEEGSFRADTNVSVRKKNSPTLGTRCELKNINSFKFIADAVEYEIERQINLLESGERVIQQTRLWDTKQRETFPLRSKEEAADYRYFNDPDLPLVHITQDMIDKVKAILPELPAQKTERLLKQGLSLYEIEILIDNPEIAQYYEDAAKHTTSKHLINIILRDVMGYLKEHSLTLSNCLVTAEKLAEMVNLLEQGTINNRVLQDLFKEVAETGKNPTDIVKEKGLEQVNDSSALEAIIREIVEKNPIQVAAYKEGKVQLFGFFIGLAMKKTEGKGDPKIINSILEKYLGNPFTK